MAPKSTPVSAVTTACVRESDLVPNPDRDRPNGVKAFNVISRQGPSAWLGVNPDSTTMSTDDKDGQYAVCYRVGNDVFWDCAGSGGNFYPTGCYGMPVAVGL